MVESYSSADLSNLAHLRLNGKLTLPSIDQELKSSLGHENASMVMDTLTMCSDMSRAIEQVGQAYEKLKVRVHKQILREEARHKHAHTKGAGS